MGRISRDASLMSIALAVAKRGTCSRLQVGVVFSIEGRTVMTGYNGAPAGMPHCNHPFDQQVTVDENRRITGIVDMGPTLERESGCRIAQHAERNAIAFAARHGVALQDTEVHVTHMPCYDCAMSLINAGITKVTYREPYRKLDGVELLKQAGIEVVALDYENWV